MIPILPVLVSDNLGQPPPLLVGQMRFREHRKVKLLYFDGTGVCVLAKRLEEGTFRWPQSAGDPDTKVRLAPQALQLLLDGVELKAGARRAWYEAEA